MRVRCGSMRMGGKELGRETMRTIVILVGLLVLCGTALGDTDELVMSEIMYNTPGSPDNEYVEIYNCTDATVDLTGWYLIDDNEDHDPCMFVGSLAPGEVIVVAGDPTLFGTAYPEVTNVNPDYFNVGDLGWALSKGGELVRLYNVSVELVDHVEYDDEGDWPTEPDGDGPSLELIDPGLDNALASSWLVTAEGGTPRTYEPQSPVDEASWGAVKSLWR
jgi:hypothetical protein